MQDTTALEKIEAMDGRINIIQGGARAGKTSAMLIVLCDLSFIEIDNIITIASDSYPNLSHGAMRDWQKLLKVTKREFYFKVNQVNHCWTNIITGTIVEFLSCDSDDALGQGRDYLFVNEATRISWETFRQLALRTTKKIWLDFNPSHEFWAHTEIMQKRTDWQFIKLTYKDNEAIPPNTLAELLQNRGDGTSNWWRVYGLGEIGSLEGNIYQGWIVEAERPEGYVLKRYGVDFGYKDPTTVVAIYENEDGELYLEVKLNQSEIRVPDLIAQCQELEPALMVCDSARPEIIAEMQANGLRAISCNKTPGEKMNGKLYNIELVRRRKVHYLATDKGLEREYLTYAWRTKNGKPIEEPQDGNDHLMDAIAYGVRDLARKPIEYAGVR